MNLKTQLQPKLKSSPSASRRAVSPDPRTRKPKLNLDSEVGAVAVARLLPWIGASLPGEGRIVVAKRR